MPKLLPPVEHRFPKGYHSGNHTQKHPGGYLTSKVKRLLKKKIYPYNNPLTNITEKIEGGEGVALALIWAALQGDTRAADILLDRIEGKVTQPVEGNFNHNVFYETIIAKPLPNRLENIGSIN